MRRLVPVAGPRPRRALRRGGLRGSSGRGRAVGRAGARNGRRPGLRRHSVRARARRPARGRGASPAPACDPGDEPLALSGPWLGILGADGHTELDLQPPYDLSVLVEQASAARYERAFLVVRVPASLGTPLTRADVESSLREGGDLRLRVRCGVHGEYVAEAVGARPGG